MRPYETEMPKIQMAGRDDTRAKGAKVHKETNYERYFFYAGKGGGANGEKQFS